MIDWPTVLTLKDYFDVDHPITLADLVFAVCIIALQFAFWAHIRRHP